MATHYRHCHYCGVSTDRIKHLEAQLANANVVARHEAALRDKLAAQADELRKIIEGRHNNDTISVWKIRRALDTNMPVLCPYCHDANSCGDYEGPTCEVCHGLGHVI